MKLLIILLLAINCEAQEGIKQEVEEERTFAEIILEEHLKDKTVSHINERVEACELSLDIEEIKETEEKLNDLIKKGKDNFLWWYYLGRIFHTYSLAYEHREDILKYNPQKIKDYLEKAREVCKRSIKLNKKFSDSYRLAADIYGKLIPLKNPMIYGPLYGRKANKFVYRALELNPNNPEVYLSIGRTYFFTPTAFGGSKKLALEYFEKAEKICPAYYQVYMWLGMWYEDRYEFKKAEGYYKKALQVEPRCNWAKERLKELEED